MKSHVELLLQQIAELKRECKLCGKTLYFVQVLAPLEADGLLLTRNEARQLAELLTDYAENLDSYDEQERQG